MNFRTLLNFITEMSEEKANSGAFSSNMKIMSLQDFVASAGEDELDEADKMLGARTRTLGDEELKGYLDRILSKSKVKTDKYKLPYVHSGNIIPIVSDSGQKYDLDKLRAAITERPAKILKQNEKMQHSDGTSSIFYNVGLPALKGLAVNEENGDFIVVDTCPGAGACKTYCYAMKGGYVQWKASSLAQTKVLNFLLNDPNGFVSMLNDEVQKAEKKYGKKGTKVIIRWHDAGDFFSPQYLDLAFNVAKSNPTVDFYAYTKLADVAQSEKPDNFLINYSMGAQPSEEKKIDFAKTKHSKVVPKELFTDLLVRVEIKPGEKKLQYKDEASIDSLKKRLGIKYSIDPKSILTYDEMMKTPQGRPGQYNVIVKPGDGDDSANRKDVLGTYLLIH